MTRPGAGAQRAHGAEPRRAGREGRTGHDHRVTAGIFMALRLRPGKMREPERGLVGEGLRLDDLKHAVGNADIGDARLAAKLAARQQQMPGLQAKEGDGGQRARSPTPLIAPVVPSTPLGTSTAIDGKPACIHRLDQRGEDRLRWAAQALPRTRHRPRHRRWRGSSALRGSMAPVQALAMAAASCGRRLGSPLKPSLHRIASFEQMAGGDEAVAAIVAGAAKHGDARARRESGRRPRRPRRVRHSP